MCSSDLMPTKQGIASRPTGTLPPLVEQKRYVLTVLLKLVWSWHEINVLKHLASPEPVAVHGAEPNTLVQKSISNSTYENGCLPELPVLKMILLS